MRAVISMALMGVLLWGASALGQEQDAEPPATADDGTYNEIQGMIDRLQGRVGDLGEPVPPESLEQLEKQVEEAIRLLGVRYQENVELRGKAEGLSTEIDDIAARRAELSASLEEEKARADDREKILVKQLEEAERAAETKREALTKAERERAELHEKVVRLNAALKVSSTEVEVQKKRLEGMTATLDTSEARIREQEIAIRELKERLDDALVEKVEEMARYRSEFFGRLRRVLGDHPDLRIVGDRFVFQSEVLFESGQAELGEEGRVQLYRFASTLSDIAATIPPDLDWILRVDGHTDKRPISNERFPSNWELSTARAVSVVKFLVAAGIPADRLVAAGFGEFHPLDPRGDEIALRRNRRIEFKLTQR